MTDIESADESREFDWREDAGDVVVRSQPAIAIYPSPAGVVIRRQGDLWCGDGDDVIWFAVEQAPVIAAAILAAANLDATALASEPTQGDGNPRDATGAARQRRYRDRKKKEPAPQPDIFDRDHTVTETVTVRDDGNGVKA